MKRYTTILLLALLTAACSKHVGEVAATGYGTLGVEAECMQVVDARTRAYVELPAGNYSVPEVAELGLRVESADPEYDFAQEWETLESYDPANDWLWATLYTVILFDGTEYRGAKASVEGVDMPYFEGRARLRVVAGIEPSPVHVTVKVANTIVRIVFTERFKGYFANGAKFTLTTDAGNEFAVNHTAGAKEKATYFYVRPARFTIEGEATKQAPSPTLPPQTVKFAATVNAAPEAGTLYTYTFDISDAGSTDEVIFTLNDDPIRTEIIDEELNDKAKPDPKHATAAISTNRRHSNGTATPTLPAIPATFAVSADSATR